MMQRSKSASIVAVPLVAFAFAFAFAFAIMGSAVAFVPRPSAHINDAFRVDGGPTSGDIRRSFLLQQSADVMTNGVNVQSSRQKHKHNRRTLTISSAAAAQTDATPAPAISPGKLVVFSTANKGGGGAGGNNGNLGAILEPDGKRNWKVLTSSGRTVSVPPKNIKHIVPGAFSISKTEEIERHELAAADALQKDADTRGANVKEVYEMLLEEEADAQTVDLGTLAELIVGDDSSVSCYATRVVLSNGMERFCFKEVLNRYEPRPLDVVEALTSKARSEEAEKNRWADLNNRIDAARKGGKSFDLQDETDEVRTAFESLPRWGCLANLSTEDAESEAKAAEQQHGNANAISTARNFLKQLGRRTTPDAARLILVATGIWDVHTNLDIIRLQIPIDFTPAIKKAAADFLANKDPLPDIDEATRIDLTHLRAFAIDEASTREIDDALSIELIEEEEADKSADSSDSGPTTTTTTTTRPRQRVWIHIADPSRYIELGSPLDREARRRASSIYLPTGTVPMFPMELAAGPLCLIPDEVSCALSIGVELDANGGTSLGSKIIIKPSLVRISRLTYDEVDTLLDPFAQCGEGEDAGVDVANVEEVTDCLRRLQWASERRLQWRKDGGSLESIGPYELPDMIVKVWSSPDEVDGYGVAIECRERYAASQLVTELMLLANEAIAMYGVANDIPMPFRSQDVQEVTDLELDCTPEGPCRSWLAIRSTSRSRVSSTPDPHGGLGLDMYVQATSPVRRYADFALHHQLKAHLRGDELPFPSSSDTTDDNDNGSLDIVRLAQDAGTNSRLIERPMNDYWLREFLRRRGGHPTNALVLSGDRWKEKTYKLLLTDLGAIMTYQSSRPLATGAELEIPSSTLAEFL
jgi:exoribonuclease-2